MTTARVYSRVVSKIFGVTQQLDPHSIARMLAVSHCEFLTIVFASAVGSVRHYEGGGCVFITRAGSRNSFDEYRACGHQQQNRSIANSSVR
mmetsp:Transcript_8766/g.20269  ORF Transcript_8766/g.20269 Transcript_8766/m.20269 type:complete len:91 (+) Transcript_8766:380-652(+)